MTLDELLVKYESPAGETSLAKGIPIKLLPWVQKEFNAPSRRKVRYVFRGVSGGWRFGVWYKRPQSFCHKGMAESFAIYKRSRYVY